jgi:hypothetical protein
MIRTGLSESQEKRNVSYGRKSYPRCVKLFTETVADLKVKGVKVFEGQ